MAARRARPPYPVATAKVRSYVLLLSVSLLFMIPLLAESLAPHAEDPGWHSVGLRGQMVLSFAVSSGEGKHVLYAETATGLWRAVVDANGATSDWQSIDAGLPRNSLGGPALAAWRVVPGRPHQLYALTGSGAFRQLYRTEDDGAHWLSVGPAPGQTTQPALAILPGPQPDTDLIFLATHSRVQRSIDGGTTWAPGGPWPEVATAAAAAAATAEAEAEAFVTELLADSSAPEQLFVLTESGRVWKSDSGGLSWHTVAPFTAAGGETAPTVTALAIAPDSGLRVWAATTAGLALSPNSGASWTMLPLPGDTALTALASDPRVPETLYAGTTGGEVYRSGDSGVSWMGLGRPGAAQVYSLALDAGSRGLLYAGTDDGLWVRGVTAVEPTPAPTATETPTFAPTPTATETPTSSLPPTATPTPTSSPTVTLTATPTATLTPTATRWPTRIPTHTPTPTWTATPVTVPVAPPQGGGRPGGPTAVPPTPLPAFTPLAPR